MRIIQLTLLSILTSLVLHAGMQSSGANAQGPVLMAQAQAGLAANVYPVIINLPNRTVIQRNAILAAVQAVIHQPAALRDAAIDMAVAANGGQDHAISATIRAAVNMDYPIAH